MIHCPDCRCPTSVSETRAVNGHTRRRRICDNTACGRRITTIEIAVVASRGSRVSPMDHPMIMPRRDLEEIMRLVGKAVPSVEVEDKCPA